MPRLAHRFLSRLALLLLLSPAWGQVSKLIDLSTQTGKNSFYVVLASRGGSATGHALVVWGTEDSVHRRSKIQALGLYPEKDADNCSSVIRTVPGRVMDEMQNHSFQAVTQQLIVKVDEDAFERSRKIARQWDCRHEFSLMTADCVEFLRAAGESLGLPMPSRFITRWTPTSYVRALLAMVNEGTRELDSGLYTGSLMNRNPMGQGVLAYADGSRIEGTFRGADHVAGTGRLNSLPGGFRYEGDVLDFQAHGIGALSKLLDTGWEPVLKGRFERGRAVKVIRDFGSRDRGAVEIGVVEIQRAGVQTSVNAAR